MLPHDECPAAEARKAIEFDPDFAMAYFNLGVNNVYLNRPEEAENAIRPSLRIELDLALREHAPILANLLELYAHISASFTVWI